MDIITGELFRHFLLTRFNLKVEDFSSIDKNNQPVQTTEWLENRFDLFEKFCFPSVMNQRCQNFTWLVLFDSDTPERFKMRVRNYELRFHLLKPIYLDSGDHDAIRSAFNEFLAQSGSEDAEYIITTRIDNDDAFHQDMIFDVQKCFDCQKDRFVSFLYGFQYDLNSKVLARMYSKNNHFVSRIEKLDLQINTVITCDHTYIDKYGEVAYLDNKSKPMWLEIIHHSNLVNDLSPESVPIFNNKDLKQFHFKTEISFYNTIKAGLRYLKFKIYLARAAFLKMLGIYGLLKKLMGRE